ncbi:hypothetical protein DUNSADRAFT_10668 [Dunaliella salina]|uniref:Secreted protein n=1 Tax=Dunaliella salina TaxID=3046 RepID=A0ABQ7GET9_DUNSA|nr:hypothetical protein DUNSADRAFT_10668 [Dunaliella salina]|eukprot:KAF5833118.1 hypothetical protein DUNSADRAFT_10668 [Dunaliella salina]
MLAIGCSKACCSQGQPRLLLRSYACCFAAMLVAARAMLASQGPCCCSHAEAEHQGLLLLEKLSSSLTECPNHNGASHTRHTLSKRHSTQHLRLPIFLKLQLGGAHNSWNNLVDAPSTRSHSTGDLTAQPTPWLQTHHHVSITCTTTSINDAANLNKHCDYV